MRTSMTADFASDANTNTARIGSTPSTRSEGFIATAMKIVAGAAEGFRAARRYDELTTAGVEHAEAIRRAFEESK